MVVTRPGPWGNPFWVERWFDGDPVWGLFSPIQPVRGVPLSTHRTRALALDAAVDRYRYAIDQQPNILVKSAEEIREALAGRDVGCWCPLDRRCHGDVLLDIANAP